MHMPSIAKTTKESTFIEFFQGLVDYYTELRQGAEKENMAVEMLAYVGDLTIAVENIARNNTYGVKIQGRNSVGESVFVYIHFSQLQIVFRFAPKRTGEQEKSVRFN